MCLTRQKSKSTWMITSNHHLETTAPTREGKNYILMVYITGVFKFGHFRQPEYLISFFIKYVPKKADRGELLTCELSLTESEQWHEDSSFQVQEIKSWNFLPSKIRFLPSFNSFKSGLLNYL